MRLFCLNDELVVYSGVGFGNLDDVAKGEPMVVVAGRRGRL
jgi:hypothetical protein